MKSACFVPILSWLLMSVCCVSASGQQIDLHWSDDGTEFWYSAKTTGGGKEFRIVRPSERTRQPAFDHQRVADALSKQMDKDVDPKRLPISAMELTEDDSQLVLETLDGRWLLNLSDYTIKKTEANSNARTRIFLPPQPSRASSDRIEVTFINQLDKPIELIWLDTNGRRTSYGRIPGGEERRQSTFTGHSWLFETADGTTLGCYRSEPNAQLVISEETLKSIQPASAARGDNRRRRGSNSSTKSPDGQWETFEREHALWLRRLPAAETPDSSTTAEDLGQGGAVGNPRNSHSNESEDTLLAGDANETNSFRRRARRRVPGSGEEGVANAQWSPNSLYLLATQTAEVDVREVFTVESSPKDQLQPELRSYSYPKPGDPLAKETLRLFSVVDQTEIGLSQDLFDNPYDTRFLKWSELGDRFWLLYNQRGHQVLRLLEIVVADGSVRTVVEETSETFIHYSDPGKNYYEFLRGDSELLWASERSGWNHLYRHDIATGECINAVTSGEWNVKRVVRVDEDASCVWFYAVGVNPEEDPYHEHFCRVNLDGSDFKILTEGDGTHQVDFQQDQRYFVDTWSRVDLAPVSELRESETGELVCELQREDAAEFFSDRRLTERFHAPGRDGVTEIWGIIHFPKDFDADRKYPVVENIYAGPHDHHVPKAFRANYRHQHRIADAGMIVVQIDGMGTAWRSKRFHDVCYKNLKDAGFPDRIAWIQAAAKKFPQMDLKRVGIYGGSAGGQNAMAALLWHHDFYRVAVADCGCHDNRMDKMWWNEQWMGYPIDESYGENSNMENAHLLDGNLMLIVGELDNNVDPATTTQVVHRLIQADKDFEFVLVTGTGHGAAETAWGSRKRLNFLKKHLVDSESSPPE